MHYANIKPLDVANSPYIGSTIFFSGCRFGCEGCFNKVAWDFNYGKSYTKKTEDELIQYLKHPQVKNANILGGEVFQQDLKKILSLVKRIKKETNVDIWVWTGYEFEELIEDSNKLEILKYVDVLVDGRFILEKKDLSLKYRGSSNQRVISVQESLKGNKVVLSKYN
ncbi:anaerobic ribonucleoside-triphosphate reductase activating protein (plasmid) [Clostridium perfringens]